MTSKAPLPESPRDSEFESAERAGEKTFLHLIGEVARTHKGKLVSLLGGVLFLFGVAAYKRKELLEEGSKFVMHNPSIVRLVDQQYEAGSVPLGVRPATTVRLRAINVEPSLEDGLGGDEFSNEEVRIILDEELPDSVVEIEGATIQLGTSDSLAREPLVDVGPTVEVANLYLKNLLTPRHRWVNPPANAARFHELMQEILEAPDRDIPQSTTAQERLPSTRSALVKQGDVSELLNAVQAGLKERFVFDPGTNSWEKTEKGRVHFTWGESNPITAVMAGGIRPADEVLAGGTGDCRNFGELYAYMINEARSIYPNRFQNVYAFPVSSGYRWHVRTGVVVVQGPTDARFYVVEPQSGGIGHGSFELLSTLYYRGAITQDQFYLSLTTYMTSSTRGIIEESIDARNIIDLALNDNTPASLGAARAVVVRVLDKTWRWLHEAASSPDPSRRHRSLILRDRALTEKWTGWELCRRYQAATGEDLIQPFRSATVEMLGSTAHHPAFGLAISNELLDE